MKRFEAGADRQPWTQAHCASGLYSRLVAGAYGEVRRKSLQLPYSGKCLNNYDLCERYSYQNTIGKEKISHENQQY
jgi:hypothetical protein